MIEKSNPKSPLSYEIYSSVYNPLNPFEKLIRFLRLIITVCKIIIIQRYKKNINVISGSYFSGPGQKFLSVPWNARGNFRMPIKFVFFSFYWSVKILFSSPKNLRLNEKKYFDTASNWLVKNASKLSLQKVILAHDMTFLEKVFLATAKKLSVHSCIHLHGLPGRYNPFDDNYSDVLVVWSNSIKLEYLKQGFTSSKIKIENLKKFSFSERLSELSVLTKEIREILVVTKSENIVPHSAGSLYRNPLGPYQYVLSIIEVLKIINRSDIKITLKPHPSENKSLYRRFFHSNEVEIVGNVDLTKYQLIIGPTSTMLLDSLFAGIPYLVYEPLNAFGLDLQGFNLVYPFLNQQGFPKALSQQALKEMLQKEALFWNNEWLLEYDI